MSKKRIFLVLPEAFHSAGGIQMFCRALCLAAGNWAQSNGVSVDALVLNDDGAPEAGYINGGFASYKVAKRSKTKLIRLYLQRILSRRYDLIVFGHVTLSPLAFLASVLNPTAKTVVLTYGIEVCRPLNRIQRWALHRVNAVLAISNHTKEELIKHHSTSAEKIKLFPCTLDPHWQDNRQTTAKLNGGPPVILSVTRMNKQDRYKGIDSVIRSLPAVLEEIGPVEYKVVGQGDDVPRLRALAAGLGVARYVNFMGGISGADLREQYQNCSLFVLPSREEGFGIVFLEAMAYAKPVVGGAHGGTPSVINDEETGLLVNNANVPQIANSITRLLSDTETSERFGLAGHERLLNEFTFDKFEANFKQVLESL